MHTCVPTVQACSRARIQSVELLLAQFTSSSEDNSSSSAGVVGLDSAVSTEVATAMTGAGAAAAGAASAAAGAASTAGAAVSDIATAFESSQLERCGSFTLPEIVAASTAAGGSPSDNNT